MSGPTKITSDSEASEAGDISFLYKRYQRLENEYELPATLPTDPAPDPPAPSAAQRPPSAPPKRRERARMPSTDGIKVETLRVLKALSKQNTSSDDYIDDAARDSLSSKKPVEIRVTFLRIIDVDTTKQEFQADVFLQARWQEASLAGKSQTELDSMDLRHLWDPLLRFNNIVGDLDESKKWRKALLGDPNPVMIFRQRVRATFREPLELKNFPVDIQALTLKVTSERSNEEVALIEDINEPSSVDTANFSDESEWVLYEHVDITIRKHNSAEDFYAETHGKISLNDSAKRPSADFECHVARKPGYFLCNIIFIVFLITALTFAAWAIDATLPEFRIPVVLFLLLTCIVFRSTTGNILPTTSYISYLDIYVLSGIIFISLQVMVICVISVYAKKDHENAGDINTYVGFGMAVLLALFNLIYLAYILIVGFTERQKMIDKDEDYYYRCMKLRERMESKRNRQKQPRGGRQQQPRTSMQEKPKIVYIDADKKNQNNLNIEAPRPKKEAKKMSQKELPPPNFPPSREDEKIYTIVPVP